MQTVSENIYRQIGRANDVAMFQPPLMRTGADGSMMETFTVRLSGTDAIQVTFNTGQTFLMEREAILSTLRRIVKANKEKYPEEPVALQTYRVWFGDSAVLVNAANEGEAKSSACNLAAIRNYLQEDGTALKVEKL
jgi:hypothetical protein